MSRSAAAQPRRATVRRRGPKFTNESTEVTVRRMVDAAVRLIQESGLNSVSFTTVADDDDLKLTRTTPMYYFGSREGLLAAIAEHGFNELTSQLRERKTGDGSFKTVKQLAVKYADYAFKKPELYLAMHSSDLWRAATIDKKRTNEGAASKTENWVQKAVRSRDEAFAEFEGAIRDARANESLRNEPTDDEIAHLVTSIIDGFLFQVFHEQVASDWTLKKRLDYVEGLLELAFDGVKSNKKQRINKENDRRGECYTLPLHLRQGHVFVELGGELWLLDTGAPKSFGTSGCLAMAGEQFSIPTSYLNLTAATLSQFVGVPCVGLLGADVLGRFDLIFDAARRRLTASTGELSLNGQRVPLGECMGIPIVTVRVGSSDYQMFFDTGAQFSYFQDDSLTKFPSAGSVTDFYTGFGQFQTETHEVPVSLEGVAVTLRCGRLPDLLGMTLMRADVKGIVGNEILGNRSVGYFPRRKIMVL